MHPKKSQACLYVERAGTATCLQALPRVGLATWQHPPPALFIADVAPQSPPGHARPPARHGTLMPEGQDQRRVCTSTPWHAPDGDDERRVCNAGPDGCSPQSWASPDRLGQAPSAAPRCSDTVCDKVCDEYGRRFYRPTLAASNVVALPPSVVPGQCAQTLMTRLGLHGRDAFDLSTLSPSTFSL